MNITRIGINLAKQIIRIHGVRIPEIYIDTYVMPSIQLMILRRYKIAAIHPDFERSTFSLSLMEYAS